VAVLQQHLRLGGGLPGNRAVRVRTDLTDVGAVRERVVELVAEQDAGALRVLGDAGRLIGRVLADVVNNLNPELIVLGGELSLAGEPVLAGVRESIDRFAQPVIARDVRVQVSELGADAQLLGAAALALQSNAVTSAR
jgi:predicted NBD/HSP70 family sugar kinase